jgi:ketosteroid isomerase-like protein
MSQERLEVLRRLYADYNARRLEAVGGLLDPEMVVELWVTPEPEIYQGVEGFRELDHVVHEAFGEFRAEPEEFIDAGGVVLVPISFRVRGAQSGVDLTQKAFHVWTLREGTVTRLQLFLDRAKALDAAGLRE